MTPSTKPDVFSQVLHLPLRLLARDRLSILLFHKVPSTPDPLVPNDVTLPVFERVIDFVSSHFKVIPLEDAVQGIKTQRLPRGAACITFDDGYAEWLGGVVPMLQKRNLHATFFITDGQFDGVGLWYERIHAVACAASGPMLELSGFCMSGHMAEQFTAARCAAATLNLHRSIFHGIKS